jgi:cell division protein FtsB
MMSVTQQVNLYLPELRPRRDLVTATRLARVVVVLAVLAVLVSTAQLWRASASESRLLALQEELRVQTVRTEQIEREMAARATDQNLVREMNSRELRLSQTRELYEFMRERRLGNLVGYSEHLKDLSRASFPGLWLTEIRIAGNADLVLIRGVMQQPAMLPDYVGRLSSGRSAITTRRFNRLLSNRAETSEEVYLFSLEAGL